MSKTRTDGIGNFDPSKGLVGQGLPYNPWRDLDRWAGRKNSEHNMQKTSRILGSLSGQEAAYRATAKKVWEALYAAGKATKRKRDGSYYILG